MASLRSKLDRVFGGAKAPPLVPAADEARPDETLAREARPREAQAGEAKPLDARPGEASAGAVVEVEAPPSSSSKEQELAALREKIAGIMARSRPSPVRADPTKGELPFVRHDTHSGPLYRRIVSLSPTHRLGRFCAADAYDADAGMLALLSLDPAIAGVDPRDMLYLDTETTGLAGGTGTIAFLLGMARFERDGDGKRLWVEQLLLRTPGEEAPILERLLAEVERASCLVSYNGKAFDLPLLRARLVMNRMPELPERPHLDLVHLARRVHQRRLGACRLASLEQGVLGFERELDVPSGEVVARYRHFLRTGDEGALVGVVEHNFFDVTAMVVLAGIYGAPIGNLTAPDLVGVSRTLRRAKALDHASEAIEHAAGQGASVDTLRERAEVARARGERDRAVADLEKVVASVDDAEARLALAKLYEHHVKRPLEALSLVDRGTTEDEVASSKRRARLEKKARRDEEKARQLALPDCGAAKAPAPRKPRVRRSKTDAVAEQQAKLDGEHPAPDGAALVRDRT